MDFTAAQIAEFLEGKVEGDSSITINNISKIEEGIPGTLSFLANPKYTQYIYDTKASIVLVNNDFKPSQAISTCLIRVENSYEALAKLLELYNQFKYVPKGIETGSFVSDDSKVGKDVYIGAFAYISQNASIGDETKIYPHVYIGDNVAIGSNTVIHSGVKVYHNCVIGNNCTIHSGSIIGADGFGFVPKNHDEFIKVEQIGNVIIQDNVEIGANTCIDRATIGSTIIKKGVKLDNLIQIAHNVEIGDSTVIAALTGVSGTVKIGSNCMIAGQVGFAGHINIGNGVKIGAQSGVTKGVADNMQIIGSPAQNGKDFKKYIIASRKLYGLIEKIEILEKELKELTKNSSK